MISGPKSDKKAEPEETQVDSENQIKAASIDASNHFFILELLENIDEAISQVAANRWSKDEAMVRIKKELFHTTAIITSTTTPGSFNKMLGVDDPFAEYTGMERAKLTMGKLSDDQLANGAFMNYDVRPPISDIISGRSFSPIVWMTAVKERIRWLSRRVSLMEGLLLKLVEGRPDKDEILANIPKAD